jgi:homoserine kinase
MSESAAVRIPASSANLGPGFDSFAAALALYIEVEVVKTGDFAVVTDLDVATDRKNLVVRAFERLHPVDEFEFRIKSEIPLSGGLGSSAAAIVAGLLAARQIVGDVERPIFRDAAEVEGHPDNVGAACFGGFVICVEERRPVTLQMPDGLAAVLVVPHQAVRTAEARKALPKQVPLGDAVFNLSNASALAVGIERGDFELIGASLGDRLHQQQRAHLFPEAAELMNKAADHGALGATVSGAGPTVLFWCETDKAPEVEAQLARATRGWAQVRRTDFSRTGAQVIS